MFPCSYACNTPMWGTVTYLALHTSAETKVRTKWSHGVQPTHRGHPDMPANKQKCVHSNPIAKAQHIGFCFAITNRAGTYENNSSLLSLFFISTWRLHWSHKQYTQPRHLLFWQLANCWKNNSKHACTSNIYIYISLVLRNSHAIKQFQRTTGTLVSTAEASFFFMF